MAMAMGGDFVKFLGTAGARFVVARQLRSSAGVFLRLGGRNVILDPGPGTLVRCAAARPRVDVTKLDAIILSHAHIDHSNDVNALIDAMTAGGFQKRGMLFAPAECLGGESRVVLTYLRGFLDRIVELGPSRDYEFDGVRFSTSPRHLHAAETYGIKFHRKPGYLSFLVDTRYFDGLAEAYAGTDILVMNVVRYEPHNDDQILHMTVAEAERVIRDVRPRKAVITHFGMTMLKAKPWEVAKAMSDRLGIEVTAASDGMTLELDEE
jgi:ribonuclease BN (tRNA processing enzyme)